MRSFRRNLIGFLAFSLAFPLAFSACVSPAKTETVPDPDDPPAPDIPSEPTLISTFAVLSDTHLQKEDKTAEDCFVRAMNICKREAGESGLDGVVIGGDLLDPVWYDNLYYDEALEDKSLHIVQSNVTRSAEMDYLKGVFEANIPQGTELIYTLGNHDMFGYMGFYGKSITSSEKYREVFESSDKDWFKGELTYSLTGTGLGESDCRRLGCHYQRVGGVSFVTIDAREYWSIDAAYTSAQEAWLDAVLNQITTSRPDENIVVVTHQPIQNSIPGSSGTSGSRNLTAILAKYPQTITLTGHIHQNVYNEYSLSQEAVLPDENGADRIYALTSVEGSSTKYSYHNSYDYTRSFNYYYSSWTNDASEGHIFRFYSDGSARIERWDWGKDKKAGADWILPSPSAQDRLTKYSAAERGKNNSPPGFTDEAVIEVNKAAGSVSTLTFTPAFDDGAVWAYEVAITRGASDNVILLDSGFSAKKPIEKFALSFDDSSVTAVSVTPIDSLYAKGPAVTIPSSLFGEAKQIKELTHDGDGALKGSIEAEGVEFTGTPQFYYTDGVLNNRRSGQGIGYQSGTYYIDAYCTDYEFSFDICALKICKAYTDSGYAMSQKRFGACLLAREYNGLIYGVHAFFDFGGLDGSRQYVKQNRILYYLTVTVPGNYIPSAQYTLSTRALSFTDAEQILTSEEGGTVKFVRSGDKVSTYIADRLADTYTLPANVLKGKGYFVELGAAKGAVGISSFGGEAEVKNVIFTKK